MPVAENDVRRVDKGGEGRGGVCVMTEAKRAGDGVVNRGALFSFFVASFLRSFVVPSFHLRRCPPEFVLLFREFGGSLCVRDSRGRMATGE